MLAAVAAALPGCVRPAAGINDPNISTEARIERALAEGRSDSALAAALAYERAVPGPQAFAWLGRALWRSGRLVEAEQYHRRANSQGSAEGRLGLARALASRGKLQEAAALTAEVVDVEGMRIRARRFAAALAWQRGEPAQAAEHLRAAAEAALGEEKAHLEQLAAVVAEVGPASGETTPVGWSGAASRLEGELIDGDTWVTATVAGQAVRLRIDPFRWRSQLSRQFAASRGVAPGAVEIGMPLALGGLEAPLVAWQVVDPGPGTAVGAEGVLGFDVLAGLRWIWWPQSGVLELGRRGVQEEAAAFRQQLPRSHWVGVRTIFDGLAAQLIVLPRVGTAVVAATPSTRSPFQITSEQASRSLRDPGATPGPTAMLLTRVGAWGQEVEYAVTPAAAGLGQVPVSTPVLLGAEFVRGWGWRWSPEDRQLALIEAHDREPTAGSVR